MSQLHEKKVSGAARLGDQLSRDTTSYILYVWNAAFLIEHEFKNGDEVKNPGNL